MYSKTRKYRWVSFVLVFQMLASPFSPVFAQESMEPTGSYNFTEMGPATTATLLDTAKDNGLKKWSVPVSSSGEFTHTITIDAPPGRLGMTPALNLAYSSGAAHKDSPVGAGWSLDAPSICRSTLNGFPKLTRTDGSLRYAEDFSGNAPFSSASGLLTAAACAICPPRTGARQTSTFFVPVRENRPVRYEYGDFNGDERTEWIEHDPSGIRRYYGADPAGRQARIVNELGTHAWLLLLEEDADGNTIEYAYHNIDEQDRPDLRVPQAKPLLKEIKWGGNRKLNLSHVFSIKFKIGSYDGALDMMNGHVLLGHRIDVISIFGPNGQSYWRYKLDYASSPDTGRMLLRSVTREAPGEQPFQTRLSYTSNAAAFVQDGPGYPPTLQLFEQDSGLPSVFEDEDIYTEVARYGPDMFVWDTVGGIGWVCDATSYYLSPPGYRAGYKFMDFDGDGDTDVVYHPAGIRTTASRILYEDSFLRGESMNEWIRMSDADMSYNFGSFSQEFLGLHSNHLIAQLGDLDGDFDIDGICLDTDVLESYGGSSGSSGPGSSAGSGNVSIDMCTSEEFWNRCGDIDPVPDYEMALALGAEPLEFPNIERPVVVGGLCPGGCEGALPRLYLVHPPRSLEADAARLPVLLKKDVLRASDPVAARGHPVPRPPFANPARPHRSTLPTGNGRVVPPNLSGRNVSTPAQTVQIDIRAGFLYLDNNGNLQLGRLRHQEPPGAPGRPAPNAVPLSLDPPGMEDINCLNLIEGCFELMAEVYGDMPPTIEGPAPRPGRRKWVLVPGEIRPGLTVPDTEPDCVTVNEEPKTIVVVKHAGGNLDPDMVEEKILQGWPAFVKQKVTVRYAHDGDITPQTRIDSDVLAPLVDINGDGASDLVLLKYKMRAGYSLHETYFVPRVYVMHNGDFHLDKPGYSQSVASNFTQSLIQTLNNGSNCEFCVGQNCKYPALGNFNSFFLDVNGDGLQDFVLANAPENVGGVQVCLGHRVYINTGYDWRAGVLPAERWSTPDVVNNTVEHPLSFLRGYEILEGSDPLLAPPGEPPVAMTSMATADINADGRQDIVFAYGRPQDPTGGRVEWRQKVYVNTNRGFVPAPITYGRFPSFFALEPPEAVANRPRVSGITDLSRMVDLDSDGLVDLVQPGKVRFGVMGDLAPKWHRNISQLPDLLSGIRTDAGHTTHVDYIAAASPLASQTGAIIEPGNLPHGLVVVKQVVQAAMPESSPRHAKQTATLSYRNFVRNFLSCEAVGFEEVRVNFTNEYPKGYPVGSPGYEDPPVQVVRRYDIRQWVEPAPVPYPLKGLEREVRVSSGGHVSCERYAYHTALLEANAAMIRRSKTHAGEMAGLQTRWSGQDTTEFDEFGNPLTVIEGNGDAGSLEAGFSVQDDAEMVRTQLAYVNLIGDPWRIGLVEREKKWGCTEDVDGTARPDALLSNVEWSYDDLGHIKTRKLPGATPSDYPAELAIPADAVVSYVYHATGLVTGIKNNYYASGRGSTHIAYDTRKLYPARKEVQYTRYLDGAPLSQPAELAEQYKTDLRSGKTARITDPNGQTFTTEYDSRGRPVREEGPANAPMALHHYRDPWPAATNSRIYLTDNQYYERTTSRDGLDRELETVEQAADTQTVRRMYDVYDGFGRVIASYPPGFVQPNATAPQIAAPHKKIFYDGWGRPVKTIEPDGRLTEFQHQPWQVREKNPRGYYTVRKLDWQGNIAHVEKLDLDGSQILAAHSFIRDGLGRIVAVLDPDGNRRQLQRDLKGRIRFANLPHQPGTAAPHFALCHDLDDNLVRVETPAGRISSTTDDELARPVVQIAADHTGAVKSTLAYDDPGTLSMGRLWGVQDPSGSTFYSYDNFGRRAKINFKPSARVVDGAANIMDDYTAMYDYDRRGHLRSVLLHLNAAGSRAGIVYERDGMGRAVKLLSVRDNVHDELADSIVYDPFDRITGMRLGNQGTAKWTYDPLSQWLTRLAFTSAGGDAWGAVNYNYDKSGNIVEETRTRLGAGFTAKNFEYDGLDRLIHGVGSGPGFSLDETITYSAGDNILAVERPAPEDSTDYQYADPALAQAVTGLETGADSVVSVEYDMDGLLTAKTETLSAGRTLTHANRHDALGKLTESTLTDSADPAARVCVSNIWNHDGARVFRKYDTAAGVKRVISFADVVEIRPDENLFVLRVPLHKTTVVEDARALDTGARAADRSQFVHTDLRGSVIARTSFDAPAAAITHETEYDPWGRMLDVGALPVPDHAFLDHQPDPGLGYYHFGLRTYDPQLRRWLSPDPLLFTQPELDETDPTELNLYAYAANNPAAKTDVYGTKTKDEVNQCIEPETEPPLEPPVPPMESKPPVSSDKTRQEGFSPLIETLKNLPSLDEPPKISAVPKPAPKKQDPAPDPFKDTLAAYGGGHAAVAWAKTIDANSDKSVWGRVKLVVRTMIYALPMAYEVGSKTLMGTAADEIITVYHLRHKEKEEPPAP